MWKPGNGPWLLKRMNPKKKLAPNPPSLFHNRASSKENPVILCARQRCEILIIDPSCAYKAILCGFQKRIGHANDGGLVLVRNGHWWVRFAVACSLTVEIVHENVLVRRIHFRVHARQFDSTSKIVLLYNGILHQHTIFQFL